MWVLVTVRWIYCIYYLLYIHVLTCLQDLHGSSLVHVYRAVNQSQWISFGGSTHFDLLIKVSWYQSKVHRSWRASEVVPFPLSLCHLAPPSTLKSNGSYDLDLEPLSCFSGPRRHTCRQPYAYIGVAVDISYLANIVESSRGLLVKGPEERTSAPRQPYFHQLYLSTPSHEKGEQP